MIRRLSGLVMVLVLVLTHGFTGPAAPASAQSLEEIREQIATTQQRQRAVEERMTQNQRSLESILGEMAGLESEIGELNRQIAGYERDIARIRELITFRVRETFKHGSALDPLAVLLSGEDAARALEKANTVQRLIVGDRVRAEDLKAVTTQVARSEALLSERIGQLRGAQSRFQESAESLQADLRELQEAERSLSQRARDELARIERERQRRAQQRLAQERRSGGSTSGSSAVSSGGMACPLDQPRSFIDSWGYPRSGGRGHRGTDMMGPHGIPVRAISDGTWHHQRVGRSAGVWGILRGSNGDHYWYLHLTAHTAADGTRVSAGQQIGTNGSTGNAHPSAPHLHFELHPGGGSAVNPYRLLRSLCG